MSLNLSFTAGPFRRTALVLWAVAVALGQLPASALAAEPAEDYSTESVDPPGAPQRQSPPWMELAWPRESIEPAVQFVGFMGYDVGGKKLFEATLSDGSTQSMSANQGFDASIGIAFLKAFDGKLATQATIGIEGWSIDASNGGLQWLAFPLDVLEFVYLGPVRLGGGISYLLNPKISGSGVLAQYDIPLKNSLGFALEADWVSALPHSARRGRLTFGGRYVWQSLEPKVGGRSVDAGSFAILLGFTG